MLFSPVAPEEEPPDPQAARPKERDKAATAPTMLLNKCFFIIFLSLVDSRSKTWSKDLTRRPSLELDLKTESTGRPKDSIRIFRG